MSDARPRHRQPAALALTAAIALALIALACGGAATPEPTATVEPSPSPEPTEVGPGRVRTSLSASCELAFQGAEMTVNYGVQAEGAAQLLRVRLLLDGNTEEDSGVIGVREYSRVATIPAVAGSRHTFRIVAEARNASSPSVGVVVRCPEAPTDQRT